MFFESYHSTESNFFKTSKNQNDAGFPLHIHKAYECYLVTRGGSTVTVDDKKYRLSPGEAVLVFPYQAHEYKTDEGTDTWVCIFSPDLVDGYTHNNGQIPADNKFEFSPDTEDPTSLLLQKSLCYKICGIFDKNREYEKNSGAEPGLVSRLLVFISENYRNDCTLSHAAAKVGYDYNYISKLFRKTFNISYTSYVNGLRISEACKLLLSEGATAQSVAEECGYKSTRTFHREFQKIMKMTPKDYKSLKYRSLNKNV